jgi:hypothetical protein
MYIGPLGDGSQALGYSVGVVYQPDSMSNQKMFMNDIENRIQEIDNRWDLLDRVLGNIIKEMNLLETEKHILEETISSYKRYIGKE